MTSAKTLKNISFGRSSQIEIECPSSKKYKSLVSCTSDAVPMLKELVQNQMDFKTNIVCMEAVTDCSLVPAHRKYDSLDEIDNPRSDKKLKDCVTTSGEGSVQKLFESMKYEINRLNTYRDNWPLTYVNPKHLAEAGLFYLQTEDKVQCAFCRGIISEWVIGDEPLKEHSKNFPLCPFLLGRDVGDIPIVSQNESPMQIADNVRDEFSCSSQSYLSYKPQHPAMAEYEKRLRTYRGWPLTMLEPKQVAEAGFYYTAITDVVTCFFCGGSLGNWDIGDDPWTEHAKYFPKCGFIELAKSAEFRNLIQRNDVVVNTASRLAFAKNDESPKPCVPNNKDVLKSEIVCEALGIFPEKLVKTVVLKQYDDNKKEFTSLQELCEELLEEQERQKPEETKSPSSPVKESLSAERTKKDILLCKICMDREMGVVFLPCGHLLACQKCAEEVSVCPLCRKLITSSVRTYMS